MLSLTVMPRPIPALVRAFAQQPVFRDKHKLHPGDILFKKLNTNNPSPFHLLISGAQRFQNLFCDTGISGDPDVIHVAIFIGNRHTKRDQYNSDKLNNIVEAQIDRSRSLTQASLQPYQNHVIRAQNPKFAKAVVQTALTWAMHDAVHYSICKAVCSVLGSPTYSQGAAQLAERFYREADMPSPKWAQSGTFCSEAVFAVLSAAAQRTKIKFPTSLMLHPLYVTPRNLHAALKSDKAAFKEVGIIDLTADFGRLQPQPQSSGLASTAV